MVQLSLAPARNEKLFSRNYLEDRLPKSEEWAESEEEAKDAWKKLKRIYSEEKDDLPERKNDEEGLRHKFISPILEQVLDYSIEKEKTAFGQSSPDYALYENNEKRSNALGSEDEYSNAVGLLEAKAWEKKLEMKKKGGGQLYDRLNPTVQVMEYLYNSEPRWAILTNGKRWRLYNQEASSKMDTYYEVDIITILENDDFKQFKYFYLLFRKQALTGGKGDAFVDKVREESNKYARDVGEDLEDNLYQALLWLTKGISSVNNNDIDPEEELDKLQNESLIFLYRLVFLFYVDSREIMPDPAEQGEDLYSFPSLVDEVLDDIDNGEVSEVQTSYFNKLQEIFKMVKKGSEAQGIDREKLFVPAYNGKLFSSEEHKFLKENTIRDEYIAKVIELLARDDDERRIDYSDLSVRHLGGIYEGLLEYELNYASEPKVLEEGKYKKLSDLDKDREDFDEDDVVDEELYLATDDEERKATGSYYTPDYIVEYIVENTVGPKVEERIEEAKEEADNKHERDQLVQEKVLDLNILDPAMGSGHFLVEVIDHIASEILEYTEKDIQGVKRDVARRCIYGVDINNMATELAKVSIWLNTISSEKPLSFLDHRIKTGNSLIGADIHEIDRHPEEDEDSERQVTIGEEFGEENAGVVRANVQEMLEKFKEIQEKDEESPEDIKEQEKLYDEFLDFSFRKRFDVLADVYTSHYFDNDYKVDDYNRLLQAFKLDEQKEECEDEEWNQVVKEDWVQKATDSLNNSHEEDNISKQKGFFHWKLEFPEVFFDIEEGTEKQDSGFDAVVGNPPYVKWSEFKDDLDLLKSGEYRELNYKCRPNHGDAQPNIHLFFQQLSYDLLDESCTLSFILPQEWTERPKAKDFRDFYLKNCKNKVIYFNENFRVFKSSRETIGTNSLIIESEKIPSAQNRDLRAQFINSEDTESVKSALDDLDNSPFVETHSRNVNNLLGEKWVFDEVLDDLISIEKQSDHRLREGKYEIGGGFQPPTDLMDYFTITEDQYRKLSDKDKKYAFPVVKSSKRLQRYYKDSSGEYWIILNEFESFDDVKSSLDSIYKHIENHRDELLDDKEEWWKFPRIRNFDIIKDLNSKLMTPRTGNSNSFCLDKENTVFKGTNAFVSHEDTENNLKLIAYLNSALLTAWYSYRGSDYHGINRYEPGKVKKMPVLEPDRLPEDLEKKAHKVISAKDGVQEEKRGFLEWVESEWNVEVDDLSLKTHMREYWEYDFDEFMRIAKKNKSQIDGNVKSREFRELMKDEWENSMLTLEPLMNKIGELEKEIDAIVFDLYDLTEEEVETILDSLDTPEDEKASILEKYRKQRD